VRNVWPWKAAQKTARTEQSAGQEAPAILVSLISAEEGQSRYRRCNEK
jgi:hypothetical protein